jgi:hypothetical protein
MVRLKELSKAAQTYFSELDTNDIFNYHRYHLGEDRYLTHLLMEQSKSHAIGFCPSARAKTEAPETWSAFLKQRRRWLLGAFSNEIFFMSDYRLWKQVPILIIYKILDFSSRSSGFFLCILLFQLFTGVEFTFTQLILIWTPLIANWIILFCVAVLIRRFKIFWMYPVMILMNPWVYMLVNLYSIATWNVRSWGGPREDMQGSTRKVSSKLASIPSSLFELRLQASEPFVLAPASNYDSDASSGAESDYSDDEGSADERIRLGFKTFNTSNSSLHAIMSHKPAQSSCLQNSSTPPNLFDEKE